MADGNQVDSQAFGPLMTHFAHQWTVEGGQVANAALYSAENLHQKGTLQWLTRVPLRLSATSSLLEGNHGGIALTATPFMTNRMNAPP